MAVGKYYRAIVDVLEGNTDELRTITPERRDWGGPGALLEIYHSTSAGERAEMIRAIGQVIQDHPAAPTVIAQLVNLAAALDLAEVEPHVRRLQAQEAARKEPLSGAIRNYLAFRKLNTSPPTAGQRSRVNGRSADHRTQTGRKPRKARKSGA